MKLQYNIEEDQIAYSRIRYRSCIRIIIIIYVLRRCWSDEDENKLRTQLIKAVTISLDLIGRKALLSRILRLSVSFPIQPWQKSTITTRKITVQDFSLNRSTRGNSFINFDYFWEYQHIWTEETNIGRIRASRRRVNTFSSSHSTTEIRCADNECTLYTFVFAGRNSQRLFVSYSDKLTLGSSNHSIPAHSSRPGTSLAFTTPELQIAEMIESNADTNLWNRVGTELIIRLKWGQTEYRGTLESIDSYMNVLLRDTEEYIDGKNTGSLGLVLIRSV
jgi:small nuclear ribonucleoprotein (snRNP)-like protein